MRNLFLQTCFSLTCNHHMTKIFLGIQPSLYYIIALKHLKIKKHTILKTVVDIMFLKYDPGN